MKIAIVHDWINGFRGGEKVLESALRVFPQADVFTFFHEEKKVPQSIEQRIREVSWMNRLPGASRYYRHYLPLYPLGARSFSFEDYDLVLSLSHALAKNVRVPAGVPHLCYCFTPMRYIYDQRRNYFGGLTPLLEPVLAGLRRWDGQGAKRVAEFSGISRFVCSRIRRFYRRRAKCIFPPVATEGFSPAASFSSGQAFLFAGALVRYKRADLVVSVCSEAGIPLWVAGEGPERAALERIAGPSVRFFGRVSDEELADLYSRCKALIYPGIEDFGIMPVECMASGRPVITRSRGGVSETVTPLESEAPTGIHLRARDELSLRQELRDALETFSDVEKLFDPQVCAARAAEFSGERFEQELEQWVSGWLGGKQRRDVERKAAAL